MKIIIIGINYYPELTGISVYSTEMCEYLASKGHNVVMLTGFPYYPFGTDFSSWNKEKGGGFKLFLNENINGVKVKRVNLYKPKKTSTIKRIFHEFSFCFLATVRLIFMCGKHNVIVCVGPPLFLGITAYIISRLKRVPYIFHIKDLQPDAAVELGMIKKGLFCSFLYAIEKFIYKKSDKVLTISHGMRNKIIAKGFKEDKVGLFYDWANPELLKPMSKDNSFSKRYNPQNKFLVLHAGNMGQKQDMRIILESAELLKEDDSIHFLIIGRGAKRSFVENYIMSHNLTNVTLLDVQPREILNEMFASADVALITQTRIVKDIVMPSKVFGPASVGRPLIIVANDDCEISRLAKEHDFGMVIEPENPVKLAKMISNVKETPKLLERVGKNGRLFMVENRKMENIINGFEDTFLKNYS